jgi:hypothetical protein
MKNEISDLRNHMFAALERLGDETITKEDLDKEILRSQAIAEVGKVIVESAKVEVLYAKLTGKIGNPSAKFLGKPEDVKELKAPEVEETVPFIRPAAKYSNKQFN